MSKKKPDIWTPDIFGWQYPLKHIFTEYGEDIFEYRDQGSDITIRYCHSHEFDEFEIVFMVREYEYVGVACTLELAVEDVKNNIQSDLFNVVDIITGKSA